LASPLYPPNQSVVVEMSTDKQCCVCDAGVEGEEDYLCKSCEDAEGQRGLRLQMQRKKPCRACWSHYRKNAAGRIVCDCTGEVEAEKGVRLICSAEGCHVALHAEDGALCTGCAEDRVSRQMWRYSGRPESEYVPQPRCENPACRVPLHQDEKGCCHECEGWAHEDDYEDWHPASCCCGDCCGGGDD
jgi:hypothetical protein